MTLHGDAIAIRRRLVPLLDWHQRAGIFAEMIAALSPELACGVFSEIIGDVVLSRTRESHVTAQSAFLAILSGRWTLEHQLRTREAAAAWSDEITLTFLVAPEPFEEEDVFAVPNYNSERPLTLGERKAIAGNPKRRSIEMALLDPHPAVIIRLLDNPKITETDVVRIAARRRIPRSILVQLAVHPKWRERIQVLGALANNRLLPPCYGLSLLPFLELGTLDAMTRDNRLDERVKTAAGRLVAVNSSGHLPGTPADRSQSH